MSWFRNAIIASVIILFISCNSKVGVVSENRTPIDRNPIEVIGDSAKLQLVDMDRLNHYLHSKNDSIYIINFWATWCVPCVEELPEFDKIAREYEDKNVRLVLVSVNSVKDSLMVVKFLESRNYFAENLLLDGGSPNDWIPKVNEEWTGSIPATIVKSSHKTTFFEGKLSEKELKKRIEDLR
jgi:thiol-disulfide isomerase/thioredoxin